MAELPHFKSRVFLAPMAGFSDAPFRKLAMDNGAGLCVTELTSVYFIVSQEKEILTDGIRSIIDYDPSETPKSIQLFGHDIDVICRAAKIVQPYFDIIDFNMGCPAKHITKQMAGAALLDKVEHIKKLLNSLVSSVLIPVTLKMRMGVDSDSDDRYLTIAKIAEEAGVKLITLHARTLKQGYSGKASWEAIKKLKSSVNIPVCGNGDITSPEDAEKMIKETGCDFVMVGRGALGNPLIFEQINDFLSSGKYKKYSYNDKLDMFKKYLSLAKNFSVDFTELKIHAMHYTKGIVGGSEYRRKLSACKDIDCVLGLLNKVQ